MISTILLAILLIVAVVGWVGLRRAAHNSKPFFLGVGGIATVLFLIVLALSCTTIVPTRDIGITTTFGRPTGELSNGFLTGPDEAGGGPVLGERGDRPFWPLRPRPRQS